MKSFQIRWRDFRSFEDTGWLNIRPLTVIIGANGSGKTSLLAPFLLLKQTLQSSDPLLALKTRGDLYDAGSYVDTVRDHNVSRQISLAFRFKYETIRPSKLKPVGKYPPGEVTLSFSILERNTLPTLSKYEVLDIYGRLLVRRVRNPNGTYSLRYIPFQNKLTKSLRSIIRKTQPSRFLFVPERLFSESLKREIGSKKGAKVDRKSSFTPRVILNKSSWFYIAITSFINSWFEQFLSNVSFIGPLREHPRRVYVLSGESPPHVGSRGEAAPEIIYRMKDLNLLKKVNEWIGRFEFGFKVKRETYGDGAFSISFSAKNHGPSINLADTGFGLSQILPLIVQSFYSSDKSLIIAEQPEIHLNPRLQTLLADLFCEVANSGRGILLETHSEHLLLRLRRLVAEKKIKPEDLSLLYVEVSGRKSIVREIPMEPNGHISDDEWPKGFFEDSLRESLGLASAQSGRI